MRAKIHLPGPDKPVGSAGCRVSDVFRTRAQFFFYQNLAHNNCLRMLKESPLLIFHYYEKTVLDSHRSPGLRRSIRSRHFEGFWSTIR
jgi:hypothetical protein